MEKMLEQAMEQYADMVYRQAYVMTGNKYDAEDVVQETFYRYMLYRPGFFGENAQRAWFSRVTANQCRDLLRKRKRRSEVSLEEAEKEAGKRTEESGLFQVLLTLPEKYREVIYLHYYAGYPVRELAGILRITENAVKKRLQRGRMLMKERMEEGQV